MKLPEHFFVSSGSGALYDTRRIDRVHNPVREIYRCHFIGTIADTQELRATIRAGFFAWPGGYPMFLGVGGSCYCRKCAVSEYRWIAHSWHASDHEFSAQVNLEDEDLYCDHCNERIESAYGGSDDD